MLNPATKRTVNLTKHLFAKKKGGYFGIPSLSLPPQSRLTRSYYNRIEPLELALNSYQRAEFEFRTALPLSRAPTVYLPYFEQFVKLHHAPPEASSQSVPVASINI